MKIGGLRRLGIGSDIGLTAVLQFVSAVLTFVLQAAIVRALDKEDVGIYFLAMTYIIIATSIADFGIAAAVFPRLSISRGGETPAFKAGLVVRMLAVVVGWAGINCYLLLFGEATTLLVVNAGFSAILFSSKFSGIRQYLEMLWRLQGRTYVITTISVIDTLLTLGIVVLLWHLGYLTVTTAWLAVPLGSIPGFIIVVWPLIGRLRSSPSFRQKIPALYYRRIALASLPVAATALLGQSLAQLEVLVINSWLTLEDVASFSTALRPLGGTMFLAVVVSLGVMPVVAQVHAGTRREITLDYIVSVSVRLVGLMGMSIVAICILFDAQIMAIFGDEYITEGHLLELNSLANCLTFLVILFDHFLLSAQLRTQALTGAGIAFVLALTLELAVIGTWGVSGVIAAKMVAIASLISYQLYALGEDIRHAAFKGLSRLLIPAGTLALSLVATSQLQTLPRAAIVLAAFAISVVLLRTFSLAELQLLRVLRAT